MRILMLLWLVGHENDILKEDLLLEDTGSLD